MKRTLAAALRALTFVVCSIVALPAQNIVQSGPWKFFRQEHPPLPYEEISTPFVVREIRGIISYGDGKPLEGAYFEIGLENGTTLGTDSSARGRFELRGFRFFGPFVRSAAIRPGTYRFKLTKDGFHSAVGTVVVLRKAPKHSVISIVMKPGEGYKEKQSEEPPNEQLIPLSNAIPVAEDAKHKKWPQKYSAVYMPVSLALGRVRTPEFAVVKQWYDIMLQTERPLPSDEMKCMIGVTTGPLDLKYCSSDDPLLRADWTVWDNEHIVHWGSIPNDCGCIFVDKYIFKSLGSFPAEDGKKYVVQVHFTKDGTPLNVAHPRLIVIQHRDMW